MGTRSVPGDALARCGVRAGELTSVAWIERVRCTSTSAYVLLSAQADFDEQLDFAAVRRNTGASGRAL